MRDGGSARSYRAKSPQRSSSKPMRPLNLLILNSARKWIGEAAHTLALAEGLTQRGHRVILGVRRGYELEARALETNLSLLPLAFSSRFDVISDWSDCRALRRTIREENIDLIHCHRGKDHWLAAIAMLYLGPQRPPLVRTRHVVTPSRNHMLNRWLYGHATSGVIGVSNAARRSLGGLADLISPDFCRVVYSAVDTEKFSPSHRSIDLRRELGASPEDILVGLIGRIQRVKGQRDFIRAAAQLAQSNPRTRFLIAGRGHEGHVERLRKLAHDLGLPKDRIVFRGWLSDLPQVMASLDIGVIASVGSEGSSRIALEYMASGVAIVATRVGGIPELLEGETAAHLVAPRSPEILAQEITRLASDPHIRTGLGQTGRHLTVERFHINRWLDEVFSLYSAVLQHHTPSIKTDPLS